MGEASAMRFRWWKNHSLQHEPLKKEKQDSAYPAHEELPLEQAEFD